MWTKHGLEVELIFLRGGSRTVSAMLGGSVDFILGSDLGATTAILQGAAITRVGVTTNTLGYSMVSQPGIKTVRDLKGKSSALLRDATPPMRGWSSFCATTAWTRTKT
jgi:ABC-type nitrate/sulfonate/bicarbonate transport system substrate-binding protein